MTDTPETKGAAAFFEEGPDTILVVNEDGRIRRANDRVEDMFGYEPDEIVGEQVSVLVPEDAADHSELVASYFDEPRKRPMGAGLELQGRRRDGSTFPVDVSLSPLEADNGQAALAAVRDISEQRLLRRKYRTLLDTAPDAAFVVGVDDGAVLEANDAAAALVGEPEGDLVDRHYSVVFPEGPDARYVDLFSLAPDECVRRSRFEDGDDICVVTSDGERVPVEVSAQRVTAAGEDVVLAMLRDVSERRQYERDLTRQIDRLERVARVLSHDLRNPLNVAEGNLELAAETGDLDRLDDVETAHNRMREIIEEALTMVRSGADVESVDAVEIAALATECWENVTTEDATLNVVSPGVVYADEGRLAHIFENLFRNAVEHGSTGNRTAQRSDDAVEHGSTSRDSQASQDGGGSVTVRVGVEDDHFFVEDDGPGIPPEDRESVFELGWTTEEFGSGLGLNIVADVAAAHGWTPTVSESEHGGARFEFWDARTAPYDDMFAVDDGETPVDSN
ncbi:PAS domain-containing sensor histidine kinase [Halobacterium salinarum]|uniref:sensor histidine kinase n=1 Tax=Halobacterium TaxID=2239 RepID=UPI0019643B77|nr:MULTISPECIES: PAS domain-containing sensor histidine kinase [Halobacterium]MDL0135694.1 PAS domain-containing sensor histidine kinase [Halobacterium salinarum]MDL0140787.1 PAS domain-containing sensor histidine kinase [Halobacterium salinarum]MDL0144784.1 PAS domain-containing sensor histidine kinase [Halobacterium salinarum]QRY23641.1 PAS domain S-box protein [Halobacterium sp. GSL-19]